MTLIDNSLQKMKKEKEICNMITRTDRLLLEVNPIYGFPFWWDNDIEDVKRYIVGRYIVGVDPALGAEQVVEQVVVWKYNSELKQYERP